MSAGTRTKPLTRRLTPIEWTLRTWNPLVAYLTREVVVGDRVFPAGTRGWFCTKCSAGCKNCYAERLNLRLGNGLTYSIPNLDWIRWGVVNLDAPKRWRQPQTVFVNSMTDLFHEAVPADLIEQVWRAMECSPRHTFQVLTKRPQRMRELVTAWTKDTGPLPNVWLGTSVEDQRAADERIPHLLAIPARVRFLSCEPLLGPVDIAKWLVPDTGLDYVAPTREEREDNPLSRTIDWVIVGGESGPHARPMHPQWARGLRDQCAAAGVDFFFKQWGEWAPARILDGDRLEVDVDRLATPPKLTPAGHRWSDDCASLRIGKKAAGRRLDGCEHNAMPV